MPIYKITGDKLQKIKPKKIGGSNNEKQLQTLVEKNLSEIFEMSFIETEAPTNHGGRIDTLAIDNDKRPVIIEYKADKSSTVLLQGLYYMDWIVENQAEFEKMVRSKLKKEITVNWKGGVKLILIAKSFEIWDKFAVNRIKEDVELYEYTLYENNEIRLEKAALPKDFRGHAKKAAITKFSGYSVEENLKRIKDKEIKKLVDELIEKVPMISEDIQVRATKGYISFRSNVTFVEINPQVKQYWFNVKLPRALVKKQKMNLNVREHKEIVFTKIICNELTSIDDLVTLAEMAYESTQ